MLTSAQHFSTGNVTIRKGRHKMLTMWGQATLYDNLLKVFAKIFQITFKICRI